MLDGVSVFVSRLIGWDGRNIYFGKEPICKSGTGRRLGRTELAACGHENINSNCEWLDSMLCEIEDHSAFHLEHDPNFGLVGDPSILILGIDIRKGDFKMRPANQHSLPQSTTVCECGI
jgi:hypothetical protein